MAGYQVEVQMNGFNELRRRIEQAPQHIADVKYKMLDRMVRITSEKAIMEAPIDTGNLRQNLRSNSKVVTLGSEFYGVVGTNLVDHGAPYPIYQEYGTGVYGKYGRPIVPKKKKFLIFKNKSGKLIFAKQVQGTRPKRFLKKGIEELRSRLGEVVRLGHEIIDKLSF